MSTNELLTIDEVATEAKIHPVTVRRKIKSGELVGTRLGPRILRVRRSDLEAMMTRIA